MAAQGGPAVDLRDDKTVRSVLFQMLVDWNGSDLKDIYEPISDQIGYFITALIIIVAVGACYGLYLKHQRKRREKPIPYKVIKPPQYLTEEKGEGARAKRVIAVVGATGFVGSHVAETLIKTGEYRVYLLGRRFGPSKILPGADAVFQVDMMDYDGLVNAFQGVHSVVNAAASIPTVYSSEDDLWRINVTGGENVLSASKAAGVENFVLVGGLDVDNVPSSGPTKVVINALVTVMQYTLKTEGLRTCALQFSQIYGIRSPFWDKLLSGEISSIPKVDQRATFSPVEFVANAVLLAETKLAQSDMNVVGKSIKIGGYPSTFKEMLSLKEWGHAIGNAPLWTLKPMAKINLYTARLTGWAPFGAEMCPAICDFFNIVEEEVDNSHAQEALGIGPVPPIRDGVASMVARYKKERALKKNN